LFRNEKGHVHLFPHPALGGALPNDVRIGAIQAGGPNHGSWLNVAEIELSALSTQCLNRRIPDISRMRKEVAAWEQDRNNRAAAINWRFTTDDARIKLKHLYPKL
jgi:hypothetical protein